jgi:preprotein translocase subunit SecD
MHRLTLLAVVAVVFVVCNGGPLFAADPPAKLEVHKAETQAADGLIEASILGSDGKIYLHKEVIITNDDVATARAVVMNGIVAVELTFTREGIRKMTKAAEEHKGKPTAVLIDGKVLAAPVITARIAVLNAVITGSFTKEEAEKLAASIKAK